MSAACSSARLVIVRVCLGFTVVVAHVGNGLFSPDARAWVVFLGLSDVTGHVCKSCFYREAVSSNVLFGVPDRRRPDLVDVDM
jgi:hypothetical protein